jgi:hypothetical protein
MSRYVDAQETVMNGEFLVMGCFTGPISEGGRTDFFSPKVNSGKLVDFSFLTVELTRLRGQVNINQKGVHEEREILKKAAAWFAREINSIPDSSSSS